MSLTPLELKFDEKEYKGVINLGNKQIRTERSPGIYKSSGSGACNILNPESGNQYMITWNNSCMYFFIEGKAKIMLDGVMYDIP